MLAFTFINSLGTGVVTSGIFFLTKAGYQFSDGANFLLGVLLGVTYIAGAVVAGAGTRWLRARMGLSSRGMLAWLMVLLAGLCVVPMGAQWLGGGSNASGAPASWPIWLTVALYSPLTGMLWPIVESYLSGGKSGQRLRRDVGIWNCVWSLALVVAYVGVSPVLAEYPAQAILVLGLSHVISLIVLWATFAREPTPHVHADHAPHPPVYHQLLLTFRLLLPTSYVVSSALSPYLAGLMPRLGIAKELTTIAAATWLATRVIVFGWLGAWSGWHGRWWPAIVGAMCLVAGFAGCTTAGMVAGHTSDAIGVAVLVAALGVFGAGMAIIYSGAIYYALEVGNAEVDAGGTHEALIGVGFTVGPLCGLGAWGLVRASILESRWFDPLVLGVVGLVMVGMVGLTVQRVRRMSRSP